MKIVTYNVNGLRQRVVQHGSLKKLLDALDADIICLQETKLSRQDLSADVTMAQGYESFFSCTRTTEKGKTCYSGVATFCRVTSAFSSQETSLPLYAEEGFTGLLWKSGRKENIKIDFSLDGLQVGNEDLFKVDSEGRCMITDHGHFVLINIYGPRADENDLERVRYKDLFFKILQRKWESLLGQGKRVCVVGDFNIAPAAIDCCDPRPGFEDNPFRKWLKSLLKEFGGSFVDVFRALHPEREGAYTCWPQNVGGEEFNYGTRIDLILFSGPCFHQSDDEDGHTFLRCHVKECDILGQFKRGKDNIVRWNGGRCTKLEGSDHVPVYISLAGVPDVPVHNTPSLAARYIPEVRGWQQTIVPLLLKRPAQTDPERQETDGSTSQNSQACFGSGNNSQPSKLQNVGLRAGKRIDKRMSSQLTIQSFFQKHESSSSDRASASASAVDVFCSHVRVSGRGGSECSESTEEEEEEGEGSQDKNSFALLEWQRIQARMQTSLPLCKGHKEPCVARFVKKSGPNIGRGFYVCARAKGPASNPEANCGFFQWAFQKVKPKKA
ncbi:endonuclease/exonuclease/phosphatase family protein isoform X1 [Wolffia australiana]